MSGAFYTVAEAAARLKLHERTILRFIRDGRLKATRVGRAYRVLAHDLNAFAGEPEAQAPQEVPRATAVVDIPNVGPELAMKWASVVTSVLGARPPGGKPMNVEVVFDPQLSRLKILATGEIRDVADLLGLVEAWKTQLRP
jgi:excisionase family DNA binding protein